MWTTATPFESGGSVADIWLTLSYAVLVSIGIAQSYVDIKTHRVYVAVTHVAGVWAFVTLTVHALMIGEDDAIVRMAVSALVLWAGFHVLARTSAESVGYGDVRLAPVIGLALGYLSYASVVTGVLAMTLIGATWAIIAMLWHGKSARVPYVPAIYGGLVIALATQG